MLLWCWRIHAILHLVSQNTQLSLHPPSCLLEQILARQVFQKIYTIKYIYIKRMQSCEDTRTVPTIHFFKKNNHIKCLFIFPLSHFIPGCCSWTFILWCYLPECLTNADWKNKSATQSTETDTIIPPITDPQRWKTEAANPCHNHSVCVCLFACVPVEKEGYMTYSNVCFFRFFLFFVRIPVCWQWERETLIQTTTHTDTFRHTETHTHSRTHLHIYPHI